MARARLLKPGFFTNEDLCELPAFGRLLFAGLWTIADREGRLDDRPKRIKAELFPYDKVDVPALLDALEEKGFIQRYCIEGAHFIQIVSFRKHQNPHVKEAASVIPSPHILDLAGTELPDEPRKGDDEPSNYAASTGNSGTSPAVPISDPVPIPNTVMDTGTEDARALREPEPPPSYPSIRREWEAKIGPMSPICRDGLKRYADQLPYTWIVAAIEETKREAKQPCWAYAEKILVRCAEDQEPPQSLKAAVQVAAAPRPRSRIYES